MLESIHLVCFCVIVFARVTLSQSDSIRTSAAPTGTAIASTTKAAQTHIVSVGKLDNKFFPDVVQAAVNDIIEFQFFPPNHSVARAEYRAPCIPYELTGPNKVGFFSGFHPVDAVLDDASNVHQILQTVVLLSPAQPPTWNLTINDTEPIFYYCSAPGSCIDHAMVGVINPNRSVSLATQKQDALDADYMVVPGGSLPTGETLPTQTGASTPTSRTEPATVTLTPSSSPSTTAAAAAIATSSPELSHSKLSGGAIAGITIGGVAVAAAIGFLLFLLGRHRTELKFLRRAGHTQDRRPAPPEMKHSYSSAQRPMSPGFPYDSEDPRFHERRTYDVPPYPKEVPRPPPSNTAELPSPPLGPDISRTGSPSSELDTRRQTLSPPPRSLMESVGPGFGISLGETGGQGF